MNFMVSTLRSLSHRFSVHVVLHGSEILERTTQLMNSTSLKQYPWSSHYTTLVTPSILVGNWELYEKMSRPMMMTHTKASKCCQCFRFVLERNVLNKTPCHVLVGLICISLCFGTLPHKTYLDRTLMYIHAVPLPKTGLEGHHHYQWTV